MVLTVKRTRRIGRGGQHIALTADLDDVRRVSAAGALGVVGVDCAPLEGGDRIFDEPRLVQRVGMDGDLHIEFIGNR